MNTTSDLKGLKIVGYYSQLTKRTYTRKADKNRADTNLTKKQYANKLQQLTNKFNHKV